MLGFSENAFLLFPESGNLRVRDIGQFQVDDIPYVFTAEEDGPSMFVYAVVGALPEDETAKTHVFEGLLHAQFCFSESSGFCFGVDANNTFVLLQALVDTNRFDEAAFVDLMDKFVKTANVWSKRLAEAEFASSDKEPGDDHSEPFPGLVV